jgi:alkaline phosphatase
MDELVTLHAIGAGNKLFNQYTGLWYPGTRILDNTHIYEVLAEAVGVE